MNRLDTTVFATFIFALSTVSSSNAMNYEWVEGTCGEPITPYVVMDETADLGVNNFDYVKYMEKEEPNADGSLSPIW